MTIREFIFRRNYQGRMKFYFSGKDIKGFKFSI